MYVKGISLRKPSHYGLTTVAEAHSVVEARAASGLGWNPELSTVHDEDGQVIKGFNVVRRNDDHKALAVVRDKYRVISNDAYFDLVEDVAGELGLDVETCGSINNGGKVFTSLAHGEVWGVVGDESPIASYISLVTSHDASTSLRILPRSVRIVCQNTFHSALAADQNLYVVRHTASWKDAVRKVRNAFVAAVSAQHEIEAVSEAMAKQELTAHALEDYFELVVPAPAEGPRKEAALARRQSDIQHLSVLMDGPTGAGRTLWSAFQAIAEWRDWTRRSQSRDFAKKRENLINRTVAGTDRVKDAAWRTAVEMVDA